MQHAEAWCSWAVKVVSLSQQCHLKDQPLKNVCTSSGVVQSLPQAVVNENGIKVVVLYARQRCGRAAYPKSVLPGPWSTPVLAQTPYTILPFCFFSLASAVQHFRWAFSH